MITDYKEIIKHVKKNTYKNNVLLSFSGGKDAWCTWITTKDHFELTPFYYYIIPGVEFIEEHLRNCEKIIGKRIRQYPHPMTYNMFYNCVFQPPGRKWIIECTDIPDFDKDVLNRSVEIDAGFPDFSCYTALGLRAADSIMRGTAFKNYGAVNVAKKTFSPAWDWKKDKLVSEIKRHNLPLSKEYKFFGRTMDGPVLLYSYQLKKHFPSEYKRLLEYFPFLESEIFRYERILKK